MQSLKELFRIGMGPSSSHTMAPRYAAQKFLTCHSGAAFFRVTLYGSLAATGGGHFTDQAVLEVLGCERAEIVWRPDVILPFHPNGMKYECFDSDGNLLDKPWLVFSVGGGELAEEGERRETRTVYPFLNFSEIVRHAEENGIPLWQIVTENEGNGIRDFFAEVWGQMQTTIHNGLNHEGVLPGGLKFPRKAAAFYAQTRALGKSWRTRTGLISSYALAVSEENAGHGIVVTAPTCGSCGVLPAVLRYLFERLPCTENEILQALAVAGLVGNTAKCNASISGAEVGCQGEVGVACAMAAAACAQLLGGSANQVEYAAEIGLEHFLGLTCDPVMGLVQIPCIERNVVAANKALAAAEYALFSDGRHRVSLDTVIRAMKDTGHDLPSLYRETSQGGLAVALAHRTLTCS